MVDDKAADPELEDLIRHLQEIRQLDFRGYKRTSLQRRIRQRMEEAGCADYTTYRALVDSDPKEVANLLNTVLINVTSFFRDPEAWTVLREEVVPRIVEQKKDSGPIRVWSVGCASGQEPYSVAMVFAEVLGIENFCRSVKIYANDLDEDALRVARLATYTARDVESVPPPLLEKYFDRINSHYVFHRELRKCIIFGRHNIVHDAPISRADLLICRNLLIYLDGRTQGIVLPRLHYALNTGGYLFLGKAETQLARSKLFDAVNLKSRIFRKIGQEWQRSRGGSLSVATENHPVRTLGQNRLLEAIVEGSATAYVAISPDGHLMLANTMARRLLEIGPADIDKPFQDLAVSYRPTELRSRIDQVKATNRPLRLDNQNYHRPPAEPVWLSIDVLPIHGEGGQLLAVLLGFNDTTRAHLLQRELESTQEALETTVEELQSTNEELETTNEELQSTNEELETTNEELESTNEELETTNEELRSINEELETTNEDMRRQSEESAEFRLHAESILRSMDNGIVVLDHEMRIQSWNRWNENVWGLRSEETIGRHLSDLDIELPLFRLNGEMRRVMKLEAPSSTIEFKAVDRRGRSITCRVQVLPLLYGNQDPRGLLLLFDDLSELRRAEDFNSYLGRIVGQSLNEIYILSPDSLMFEMVNRGAELKLGYTLDQLRRTTLPDLMPDVSERRFRDLLSPLIGGEKDEIVFETRLESRDRGPYPAEICVQHLKDQEPTILIVMVHDTTERQQLVAEASGP
ncbi:chemotaxis protein CheR [Skermanella stibiiresistens SB22]|uniref:protein-glutamate O-methyltransferase n=1 Tax=Skermanella stibiiresistens SB22 TaxID=1385369 RepID=W9HAT7_9PROT|nr:CheR family methyltransferase [Skermanella stibiiresistens]EWY40973.1 chemotaxis protein CheR [Skermanella stibiiresistens SB22]